MKTALTATIVLALFGLLTSACGNDTSSVYSYVSSDDGRHWQRYTIDDYMPANTDSYPTVVVANDGSIWALHVSKNEDDASLETMKLYHSTNHGKTWSKQVITPRAGDFVYTWLGVAKDGRLGMASYFRADKSQPWKVYGSIWKPGQPRNSISRSTAKVLPQPGGPCSTAAGDGQSGQRSSQATAASLLGAIRKSSAPKAGRWGNSKAN